MDDVHGVSSLHFSEMGFPHSFSLANRSIPEHSRVSLIISDHLVSLEVLPKLLTSQNKAYTADDLPAGKYVQNNLPIVVVDHLLRS